MVDASSDEIDGYTGQRMICDGIRDADWFWHVCHFGRVYNNVTGLKKSLRQYLRANNHSLVACDVANSQPLLVGLLCRHMKQGYSSINLSNLRYSTQFNHYIEIDQEFLDRLYHSSPQKQEEEGGGGQGDSLYDVVLTKSSQLGLGDVESYVRHCEEGRFYDELMVLDDNQTDRETFKKQVFTQVFYETVARIPGYRIMPPSPCAESWSSGPGLGALPPAAGPAPAALDRPLRPNPVYRLLHLAVATVATLHRVRRCAEQPLVQEHQGLLQPRRQQLLQHLP